MGKEGKYIYCIIGTKQERNFGPVGIDKEEVLTIGYDDLSMVVSNHTMAKLIVNRQNLVAHEKVIEEVMKEFNSVLPIRFGTIAASCDEIRNLLDRRHREFKNHLKYMDHKIELGVKGIWQCMDTIYKEVVDENREIKELKEKIQNDNSKKNAYLIKEEFSIEMQAKIEVGKMVEQALIKKKEENAEKIIDALKRTVVEYKLNKTIGDEMFVNASFLVDKGREKEFDNIIDDLRVEYKDKVKFMYAGPLPVFNFVNIVIYPEEWEK